MFSSRPLCGGEIRLVLRRRFITKQRKIFNQAAQNGRSKRTVRAESDLFLVGEHILKSLFECLFKLSHSAWCELVCNVA